MILEKNFFRLVIIVFLIMAAAVHSQKSKSAGTIGVVPFSPEGITEDEALIIAKAVRSAIVAQGSGITGSEIMDAVEDVDCDDSQKWALGECIVAAGRECGADFMIGGTMKRVDSQCTITPALYDIQKRTRIWRATYSIKGSAEDIYKEIPQKIAAAITGMLWKGPMMQEVSTPKDSVEEVPESTQVVEAVVLTPPPVTAPVAIPERKVDYGIVNGFTISAGGYVTLVAPGREQTRGGFMVSFLYPTGERSQIRVKTGIPLFRNPDIAEYVTDNLPDPYLSLEHDWAWKNFRITGGLAYMYMQRFIKKDFWDYFAEFDGYWDYDYTYCKIKTTEKYDNKNALNATVGFRAGKAMRGFYGRFSWPLAFSASEDEPLNIFFEYNAFGVFGWKKNKIGIGLVGMNKIREPDPESITTSGTADTVLHDEFTNHFLRDENRTNEICLMFPVVRYARLIGERVVLNITFELGGTILPRFLSPDFFGYEENQYENYNYNTDRTEERDWWKPSLGLQIVYSFAPLSGPHMFDGSF